MAKSLNLIIKNLAFLWSVFRIVESYDFSCDHDYQNFGFDLRSYNSMIQKQASDPDHK